MANYQDLYPFFRMEPLAQVDEVSLRKRIQRPDHPVDVVLDTDTYNEIDDQYALAYLVLNPEKLHLQAVYAAPFCNSHAASPEEGMERSYDEIVNILTLLNRTDLLDKVYRGSRDYLADEKTPQPSEAAEDLARRAMNYTPDAPLYVVAIGAITNVASALIAHPEIRDRIVIVWLGGNALHWPDTHEFNMMQDVAAARVVYGCGAALVMLPCAGVVSSFTTTGPELRHWLKGKNKLCDYLCSYTTEEAERCSKISTWSRVIWDVTAVAWLLNPAFMSDQVIPSPIPEYDFRWGQDSRRHPVRYVYHINRDLLLEDLFKKLSSFE